MNPGKSQNVEDEFRKPTKKRVRPGTNKRDPYPIVFWDKIGIPPCEKLWPSYAGIFDGDSVIVEDPGDMHEIYTMGYFGKRVLHRRGYEHSIGDIPVVRERQWKKRVEWAAECGYILVPPSECQDGLSPRSGSVSEVNSEVALERVKVDERSQATCSEVTNSEILADHEGDGDQGSDVNSVKSGCARGDEEGVEPCQAHSGDTSEEMKPRTHTSAELKDEQLSNDRLRQGNDFLSSGESVSQMDDAGLSGRSEVVRELEKSSRETSECREQGMQRGEKCEGDGYVSTARGQSECIDKDDSKNPSSDSVEMRESDELQLVGNSEESMGNGDDSRLSVDIIEDKCKRFTKEVCVESESLVKSDEDVLVEVRNEREDGRKRDDEGKGDGSDDLGTIKERAVDEEEEVGELMSEVVKDGSSEEVREERSGNKMYNTSEIDEGKEKGKQRETSSRSGEIDNIEEDRGMEDEMQVEEMITGGGNKVEQANDPRDVQKSPVDENAGKEEGEANGRKVELVETEVKQVNEAGEEMEIEKVKDSVEDLPLMCKNGQGGLISTDSADEKSVLVEPIGSKNDSIQESNSPKSCHNFSSKSDPVNIVHFDSEKVEEETATSTFSASKPRIGVEEKTSKDDEAILHDAVKEDGKETAKEKTVGSEEDNPSPLNETRIPNVEIEDNDLEEVVSVSTCRRNEKRKFGEVSRKRRHSSNRSSLDALEGLENKVERTLEEEKERKSAKVMKMEEEEAVAGSQDCEVVETIRIDVAKSGKRSGSAKFKGKEGGGVYALKEIQEEGIRKVSGGKESEPKKCPNESLNKSSDCEILEIEEDSMKGKPKGGTNVAVAGPSKEHKGAVPWGWQGTEDSDDDIMEVSMEEDDVQEVTCNVSAIRRGDVRGADGTIEMAASKSDQESKKTKFQKMLSDIRKTLPSDTEVVKVSAKDSREGGENSRQSGSGKKETTDDTEDDDIIEINLQKSDMIELEECDVDDDNNNNDDDDDDDELQCTSFGQAKDLQRRMQRGSVGFKRMESWLQNPHVGSSKGDAKVKKEEKDNESIETGSVGSDCEVVPCIVIPDTDSECEEIFGAPTLESDPSIFLPSLDVLQLIPEEAFFLVYGLGCLQVWDVRGVGRESSTRNENIRSSAQDDESGCDDDGSNSVLQCSVEEKGKDIKAASIPSQSGKVKTESFQKNSNSHDCIGESKSTNESSPNLVSDPLNKSVDVSISPRLETEEILDVVSEESKLNCDSSENSTRESRNKENATEQPISLQNGSKSSKKAFPEKISRSKMKGDTHGPEANDVRAESNVSLDKARLGSNSFKSSDKVPVHSQSVEKSLNSSLNDSVSIIYDAESVDEVCDVQKSCSRGKNDNNVQTQKGLDLVRENGDSSVDPSITVIDLADSPPYSRQWGRKGGWSSDEDEVDEDVVAMDTDCHEVDCQPSVSGTQKGQQTERTLNGGYLNPMTIIELWNAFRCSRAAISPTAIPFETSYAVYHHFRAKRWVVKPGIRFGGDFLLYKDGPPFYHATYLVLIDNVGPDGESRFNWHMLGGRNRLAENVGKDLMLCRVEWPPTMTEQERKSPKCLIGLVVQEIIVRRWTATKGREDEDEVLSDEKDSFIPLKL